MNSRINDAIQQAKKEIEEDIRDGVVPADIHRFGDLHSFVDANEYGSLSDRTWTLSEANEVQEALDRWIQSGRPQTEGV